MSDTPNPPEDEAPSNETKGVEVSNTPSVSIAPEVYIGYAVVVALVWLMYIWFRFVTDYDYLDAPFRDGDDIQARLVMLDQLQGIAWGLTAIFVLWTGVQIVRALNRND